MFIKCNNYILLMHFWYAAVKSLYVPIQPLQSHGIFVWYGVQLCASFYCWETQNLSLKTCASQAMGPAFHETWQICQFSMALVFKGKNLMMWLVIMKKKPSPHPQVFINLFFLPSLITKLPWWNWTGLNEPPFWINASVCGLRFDSEARALCLFIREV